MSALFASGRIVDLVIALTAIEVLVLALYHRRTGRGIPPIALVSTFLSGLCLMVALRCALVGAWWGWIALLLVGSLAAHLVDLRGRWHQPRTTRG